MTRIEYHSLTLEEINQMEREAVKIRDTMRDRIWILNRHIQRLQRRRHNMLEHPNWQMVSEKAAWKK